MSAMVLIALPPLSAAQIMLLIDRFLGAHFFDTQAGRLGRLWQHFFWIFGHPEVYILIFPAFAFISEIIPVFSRKPIFGYPVMVGSDAAIGFLSLGVWAHHMFTVGMTSSGNTFFTASTMLVGVPDRHQDFQLDRDHVRRKAPLHHPHAVLHAFLFQFLIAGLDRHHAGAAPFDWQLNDSYFVVGHFHYMLVGGLVFGIFAAMYYWFPKVTGRMLNERWASGISGCSSSAST